MIMLTLYKCPYRDVEEALNLIGVQVDRVDARDFEAVAANAPTRAPRQASPLAAAFRAAVGAVAGSSERKVAL